jgi:hypothetical protein
LRSRLAGAPWFRAGAISARNKPGAAEFNLPTVCSELDGTGRLMSRRQNLKDKGFVLETGGRVVLAFMASGIEQARSLCTEHWFAEELASYKSSGRPVWDGSSEFRVRRANLSEAAEIEAALTAELAREEYEGYLFVFFVPVDPALH